MNTNLRTARSLRRKILKQMESQQLSDSETQTKLRNAYLPILNELIRQVIRLLEHFEFDASNTPADKNLFVSICPELQLSDWYALRLKDTELAKEFEKATSEFERAAKEYSDRVPLGFLSSIGKKEPEKSSSKR